MASAARQRRWQRQRGGGSTAAVVASLAVAAAWRKRVFGGSACWVGQNIFQFQRTYGMRRGVVTEVQSFRYDIFLALTMNFFLDAHGRGQDAISEFWPRYWNTVWLIILLDWPCLHQFGTKFRIISKMNTVNFPMLNFHHVILNLVCDSQNMMARNTTAFVM